MNRTQAEMDVHEAAEQLAQSQRGRQALKALLAWLDDGGLALDATNKSACFILLHAAWGSFPGTARDAMRDALGDEA